jgi:hypothetical protein
MLHCLGFEFLIFSQFPAANTRQGQLPTRCTHLPFQPAVIIIHQQLCSIILALQVSVQEVAACATAM